MAAQLSGSARACYGLVLRRLRRRVRRPRGRRHRGNGWSWASPIGWAQAVHPYSDDRWAPLLLCVLATAALLGGAVHPPRPPRPRRRHAADPARAAATAGRGLSSPLGLAWRLQRGALTGWLVGLALLGALYGGLGDSVETLLADNPAAQAFFPGATTAGLVDAYLATTLVMSTLMAVGGRRRLGAPGPLGGGRRPRRAGPGHGDQPLGLAGQPRARRVRRARRCWWPPSAPPRASPGRSSTGDASDVGRLLGGALAHLPAVWVLAGVALALVALVPRAATAASWGAVAVVVVVTLFGPSLDWPAWVQDLSPFAWVPTVPVEAWTPGSAIGLLAVVAALLVVGFAAFRRRDLVTG